MAALSEMSAPSDFRIFRFRDAFPVRITDRTGCPWFVAADVCKALEISNPSKTVTQLDDDEHTTLTFSEGRPGHGAQKINIISESGLYALIIRSSKPAAREFRKWITSEVLPAIRRDGSYSAPAAAIPNPPDPDLNSAKRTTAELVDQTNRRLAAGESIPAAFLRYVAEMARIVSGCWYRDNFGMSSGRGIFDPVLPEFNIREDKFARAVLRIVRKRGTAMLRDFSQQTAWMKVSADLRRRIIVRMVEEKLLQCEGIPGEQGSKYWL
jgi:prophage antirepressor-like protein